MTREAELEATCAALRENARSYGRGEITINEWSRRADELLEPWGQAAYQSPRLRHAATQAHAPGDAKASQWNETRTSTPPDTRTRAADHSRAQRPSPATAPAES